MSDMIASCNCKAVRIKASGKPIVCAVCYCSDCRTAGHDMETLPNAPKLVCDDGGTPGVMFRKDRVKVVEGADFLREYRLNAETPTRRLVAVCCNSPMVGDFTNGFWVSVYADRFGGSAPPPQLRIMVKGRPDGVALSNAIPSSDRLSARLLGRLIFTWIKMGFRRPALPSFPPINIG